MSEDKDSSQCKLNDEIINKLLLLVQEQKPKELDNATIERLCELAKGEYEAERERFGSFEVRTGVLFSLTGALAPSMMGLFHIPSLKVGIFNAILLILLEIASVSSAGRAGFLFLQVLRTRPVEHLNIESILTPNYMGMKYVDLLTRLMLAYKDMTLLTRKSTEKRVTHYQRGLVWLSITFVVTFLTILFTILLTDKG